jgi:hypothetical protein
MKSLMGHINVLNLLLALGVFFFVHNMLLPLLNARVAYTPATVKKADSAAPPVSEKNAEEAAAVPPQADYGVIAQHNLFHPERKIPIEKKEEIVQTKPEFTLYGTLVTGDISLAYMDDKKEARNTPGRGKRQTALRMGDTLTGFVLKEIRPDSVLMIRGEEQMEVKIVTQGRKKERDAAGVASAGAQGNKQLPPQPKPMNNAPDVKPPPIPAPPLLPEMPPIRTR